MARTVEDVLARRLRALFLNAGAAVEMSGRVAHLMAGELGYGSEWEDRQVAAFRDHRGEFHAVVSGKVKALLRDKTRIRVPLGEPFRTTRSGPPTVKAELSFANFRNHLRGRRRCQRFGVSHRFSVSATQPVV